MTDGSREAFLSGAGGGGSFSSSLFSPLPSVSACHKGVDGGSICAPCSTK